MSSGQECWVLSLYSAEQAVSALLEPSTTEEEKGTESFTEDLDLEIGAEETVPDVKELDNQEVHDSVHIISAIKKNRDSDGFCQTERILGQPTSAIRRSVLPRTLLIKLRRCDHEFRLQKQKEQEALRKCMKMKDAETKKKRYKTKRKKNKRDKNVPSSSWISNDDLKSYFDGYCNLCGSSAQYEETKTYFRSSHEMNLLNCCTCHKQMEPTMFWTKHNLRCFTTDYDDDQIEIINKRKMFICGKCSTSLSQIKN